MFRSLFLTCATVYYVRAPSRRRHCRATSWTCSQAWIKYSSPLLSLSFYVFVLSVAFLSVCRFPVCLSLVYLPSVLHRLHRAAAIAVLPAGPARKPGQAWMLGTSSKLHLVILFLATWHNFSSLHVVGVDAIVVDDIVMTMLLSAGVSCLNQIFEPLLSGSMCMSLSVAVCVCLCLWLLCVALCRCPCSIAPPPLPFYRLDLLASLNQIFEPLLSGSMCMSLSVAVCRCLSLSVAVCLLQIILYVFPFVGRSLVAIA